jgi:hypothetical protein
MAKETFPKILTDTTIISCKKTKGNVELKFGEMKFTGSQIEHLGDWIDDDIKVRVTIQVQQPNLPQTQ